MCRMSRAIMSRFNSKTQSDIDRCFSVLYGHRVCAPQKGTNMAFSVQSSINLGDTLLEITREWKTAKTWFLARLFIYQSSIVSQILVFIHRMLTILSFGHMTGENRELAGRCIIPLLQLVMTSDETQSQCLQIARCHKQNAWQRTRNRKIQNIMSLLR